MLISRRSKRKRPESVRTANKHDFAGEQSSGYKNKRLKSQRDTSPTLSYLSMRTDWSVDPPTNCKHEKAIPLHSRVREVSPTSTLRTDWSMDPPANFKRGKATNLHSRVREVSPTSTLRTDWSMDPPANLKRGKATNLHSRVREVSPTSTLRTDSSMDPPANFQSREAIPLHSRLLIENHLKCPMCKLMLTDPVSISCGHSYCRNCINAFWDNHDGNYACPQCGQASKTRPVLNINVALAEVVKNLQQGSVSPALPPQSYAGPEDVACDFCTEHKLKAVKSCSTCDVFFCETHIRQHYTIPALQKHKLYDMTGEDGMKMKTSQKRQKTGKSFSPITSGQKNQMEETQDIIKEIAVQSLFESVLNSSKLQTHPKRSAKTPRSKAKDNKDVSHLARVCSTLQQEVSVLKKSISKYSNVEKTKKVNRNEEDYADEDSDERSDDEERSEDSFDEEQEASESRSDEEDGDEDSCEDKEDSIEYSDERSDDQYSGSSDDRSSLYSTDDEDY